jgi:Zn-dependent protease
MIHLGSIGRTSIDVDISFLILMAFFVASFYDRQRGIENALLWIPVLFLSILLHELAHAAMIAAFGYGPSQIVLGGMGGVTLNRRHARPWHDMVISLAGPLASFAIAFGALWTFAHFRVATADPMLRAFFPLLYSANLWWGTFNLIPVSPLDGGHAVLHFFRTFLRERTAFVIAVWIAIVCGKAVTILGLLSRWFFIAILIGWYVWTNFQKWQDFRRHGSPDSE